MKELIMLLSRSAEREKAAKVISQVRAKIRLKNLFGWRSFIDDVATDLVSYMIATHFQYSVGAYITCGMQSAIDHCRWCNAKCRRGDFESTSIDDDDSYLQLADDYNMEEDLINEEAQAALYYSIVERFGAEIASQLRPIIYKYTDKIERKVLKKIKTKEFKEFLMEGM